jgi:RNA polymerase sigma factor (sigma-70 family)
LQALHTEPQLNDVRGVVYNSPQAILTPGLQGSPAAGLFLRSKRVEHTGVSLQQRGRLTNTGNNIHDNNHAFDPDDAIERAVRQQHDLRLIKAKDFNRLFAEYLPVIQVTCAMRGLTNGETMEVAGIVWKRMHAEVESGKDFRRVSVYGSFVWKARWESAGALERRAGSANVQLLEPERMAELAEVAVDDDYSHVMCDDYANLYEAIEQLTEKQRLVIELVYLDELSVSEAAEYIGVEPNAVSQLKFNALKKLALIMGA